MSFRKKKIIIYQITVISCNNMFSFFDQFLIKYVVFKFVNLLIFSWKLPLNLITNELVYLFILFK